VPPRLTKALRQVMAQLLGHLAVTRITLTQLYKRAFSLFRGSKQDLLRQHVRKLRSLLAAKQQHSPE